MAIKRKRDGTILLNNNEITVKALIQHCEYVEHELRVAERELYAKNQLVKYFDSKVKIVVNDGK